mgnify:CR=1 FL=1
MPNWCQIKLSMDADKFEAFKSECCVQHLDQPYVSFNKILPMPTLLHATESPGVRTDSRVDSLMRLLSSVFAASTTHEPEDGLQPHESEAFDFILSLGETIDSNAEFNGNPSSAQVKAQLGEIVLQSICRNIWGSKDWYDWRLANWGVKWDVNPNSCYEDESSFFFQTPWGPPIGIFERLCERYPDFGFTMHYAEEGMVFAGVYEQMDEGGFVDSELDLRDTLIEVFGYDPDDFDD